MGLPSINITFRTLGMTAIARSQKGTVALIVRDDQAPGGHVLTNIPEIPKTLAESNCAFIKRAFIGYVKPPRKVLLYVLPAGESISDALDYFAMQQFDYLSGPPDLTAAEAQSIATWVKSERLNDHTVKAVLPETPADEEGVINFTTTGIKAGSEAFTPAQYCSRIAGLIAGTPIAIASTYAPLPEVSEVTRLTKAQGDDAVDAGKFMLIHDGEKVKAGRGVNSLVTLIQNKGAAFRKIKIVEAVDMMKNDIRMTAQDHYIGKNANSYSNKCLLIMSIKGYLEELERTGILEVGKSVVELNLAAQESYLKSTGVDTSGMTALQIKQANTGSKVFLQAQVSILDAIEDIDLDITI